MASGGERVRQGYGATVSPTVASAGEKNPRVKIKSDFEPLVRMEKGGSG